MSDIFISYASADRERARLLADALTRRGYAVWWDRTIPPGRVFDEVIQEAIQAARCMIVLWSADSVRSNWVKTEAAEGAARGILVPALIGEVAPPIEFKRIQSANLTHWDGDEAHGEYASLLVSVARLMRQAPAAVAAQPAPLRAHESSSVPGAKLPHFGTIKTFALGALFALLAVGAYWYFTQSREKPVPAPQVNLPPATQSAPSAATPAALAAGATKAASPSGRINLLSPERGGQLVTASSERWKEIIDGKEETYAWTDDGFGVFAFRDGRPALIDTFTVLVPSQSGTNIKDFELFVSNAGPNGPFESIGRFSTQNLRVMQNPYQAFKFAPVKARYFKFQSINSHDGKSSAAQTFDVQLFGELQ